MSKLTDEQYAKLIEPIHKSRVGQNAKGFSHVEAWDITRTLNRIFGICGWDYEVVTCEEVRTIDHAPGTITTTKYVSNQRTQVPNEETRYTVVYRAVVRLVVKATDGTELAHFDGVATGDATNQPSIGDAHDMAAKTADSQALKRAAVKLGDQFGLSLYNGGGGRADENGYLRPVVIRTLNAPGDVHEVQPAQHDDEPVQADPEQVAPVSAPPAQVEPEPVVPAAAPAPVAGGISPANRVGIRVANLIKAGDMPGALQLACEGWRDFGAEILGPPHTGHTFELVATEIAKRIPGAVAAPAPAVEQYSEPIGQAPVDEHQAAPVLEDSPADDADGWPAAAVIPVSAPPARSVVILADGRDDWAVQAVDGEPLMSDPQKRHMFGLFAQLSITDRDKVLHWQDYWLKRDKGTSQHRDHLTARQADIILAELTTKVRSQRDELAARRGKRRQPVGATG